MKDGEHTQKLFNDMKQVTTYKDGKKAWQGNVLVSNRTESLRMLTI